MDTTVRILDKIDFPADLRKLNNEELNLLAEEIRELMMKRKK